jgi:hypothetical protein
MSSRNLHQNHLENFFLSSCHLNMETTGSAEQGNYWGLRFLSNASKHQNDRRCSPRFGKNERKTRNLNDTSRKGNDTPMVSSSLAPMTLGKHFNRAYLPSHTKPTHSFKPEHQFPARPASAVGKEREKARWRRTILAGDANYDNKKWEQKIASVEKITTIEGRITYKDYMKNKKISSQNKSWLQKRNK